MIMGRNNANSRTCDRMLEGSSRRKRKPHDERQRKDRVAFKG